MRGKDGLSFPLYIYGEKEGWNMKLLNIQKRAACLAVFLFLMFPAAAYASERMAVVETYTGESEISLYIKGISVEPSDIRVQAGTAVCGNAVKTKLSDSSQKVKTLLMLDNSLSMPKAARKLVSGMLLDIIAQRMEQEQMAVAVFHDGLTYLTDYTADSQELSDAVSKIEYVNSNTHLTDVLYDAVCAQRVQKQEDVFWRVIVISDGMDNKSIGYTKDELFSLLKDYPVPVCTIGVETGRKDNHEQLKNMFAIARLTGSESFLLKNKKVLPKICKAIRGAGDFIKITASPPQEMLDGSTKTVKITLDGAQSISAQMQMPQVALEMQNEAGEQDGTKNGENSGQKEAETADNSGTQEKTKAGNEKNGSVMHMLPLLILLAAAGTAVWFFFFRRKNKAGKAKERKYPQPENREELSSMTIVEEQSAETEIMQESQEDEDATCIMCGSESCACAVLTDIRQPSRRFQAPLDNPVIIGRKPELCSIVLGYDRSVSGKHCKITCSSDKYYITDLHSSNGTFVDGSRILAETQILPGSIIRMGTLEVKFDVIL